MTLNPAMRDRVPAINQINAWKASDSNLKKCQKFVCSSFFFAFDRNSFFCLKLFKKGFSTSKGILGNFLFSYIQKHIFLLDRVKIISIMESKFFKFRQNRKNQQNTDLVKKVQTEKQYLQKYKNYENPEKHLILNEKHLFIINFALFKLILLLALPQLFLILEFLVFGIWLLTVPFPKYLRDADFKTYILK